MLRADQVDDEEIIINRDDAATDTQSTITLGSSEHNLYQNRYIEPILLIFFTACSLSETTVQNVIELHYCHSTLNIDQHTCFNKTSGYEDEIQTYVSNYQIVRSVIECLTPALASFCVGPWSDVFGRKPLIILVVIGMGQKINILIILGVTKLILMTITWFRFRNGRTEFVGMSYSISYSIWTLLTTFSYLHPSFFLFASIPIAFTGGQAIMFMGTFCYMCDITTIQERAVRLGILQAIVFIGSLIGSLLCAQIVRYNYTAVFGTSSVLLFVLLIYTLFFIEESVIPNQELMSTVNKNPLSLEHAKGMFNTCFTEFSPDVRMTVVLLMMVLPLSLIVALGEGNIIYLFLQETFEDMDVAKFAYFNAYSVVLVVIGTLLGLWLFSNKLQYNEIFLLSMSTFLRILAALVMLFTSKMWHIYFSRILSCFTGVVDPLIRLFLSKIIPHDQLGKVFSLLAASGALTPLLCTIIYNSAYDMTVAAHHPAIIFLLSSSLLLTMLYILSLAMMINVQPINEGTINAQEQGIAAIDS